MLFWNESLIFDIELKKESAMSIITYKNFDKILKYCLDNEKKHVSFGYMLLWRNLFTEYETEDVQILIEEMEKLSSDVFSFDLKTHNIQVTPRTKIFFEDGGYEQLEANSKEAIKKETKKESLELTKLIFEIEDLKSKRKDQRLINLVAILSLVISILLALREFKII